MGFLVWETGCGASLLELPLSPAEKNIVRIVAFYEQMCYHSVITNNYKYKSTYIF